MDTAINPVLWRRMLRFAYEKPLGLGTVSQSVALWQHHYPDPADYVPLIRPFAQLLATHLAKPHLQSELALLLIAAFNAPVDALPADPSLMHGMPTTTQTLGQTAPPAPHMPQPLGGLAPTNPSGQQALHHCLGALYVTLLTHLQTLNNGASLGVQLRLHLGQASTLQQCAIPQPHRAAWLSWVQWAPQHRLDIDLSITQGQQLINVIYVYLVNALGPVETDMLLSHAIQAVEQTDIGRAFSPRKFL